MALHHVTTSGQVDIATLLASLATLFAAIAAGFSALIAFFTWRERYNLPYFETDRESTTITETETDTQLQVLRLSFHQILDDDEPISWNIISIYIATNRKKLLFPVDWSLGLKRDESGYWIPRIKWRRKAKFSHPTVGAD